MTQAAARPSTWAPLRIGVFRAMWLAALVSNTGTWMQTVGAQWLLVHEANAAILVALVQTADMLPDVVFGLVGGVLADTLDRRRLLIAVQVFMVVGSTALTVLTAAGQMPPALLLTFTFLLGSGSVITVPAYQSSIPEMVPRSQLRAASALSSISINIARAVGPAIAGLLIARAGVAAVFGLNTLTFVVFALVVAAWRPPPRTRTLPEPFVSALRSGGRYVRYSPVVRRILFRSTLFLVPASALWALLPLVATRRLGLGAVGYGFMLGALGVGAVAGAVVLSRVRDRLSTNRLMGAASLVYAAVLVAVVLIPSAPLALVLLLPAGMAWIAVLADQNAALQLFLPAWVRARGLAVYQMVLYGSQAVGAILWGVLAGVEGLVPTFLVAAAALVVGVVSLHFSPVAEITGLERGLATPWPEPQLAVHVEPGAGPVLVTTTYTVAAGLERRFVEAMSRVRRGRLRTGATQWGLFRDGEAPQTFVELFVVPSWEEHLRQHRDRLTEMDRRFEAEAKALSRPAPVTRHLLGVDVED